MKRVILIATLVLATIGLVGIFASNVYAHPSYPPPCVASGCHAAGDPRLTPPAETSQTVIPTGTVDTTCAVTTSDIVPEYHGDAFIKLTATDKPGGWGVGYIYYTIDGSPVRLVRVPVDWANSMGSMSCDTTIPVPAPATGEKKHTITYWSQDNYGVVEARTTETFTVFAAAVVKLPTTTKLTCSVKTITAGHYVTLTAKLSGGTFTDTYVRFEKRMSGGTYSLAKTVKVSSTGDATYRYKVTTKGTRYNNVRFLGNDTYLPAPVNSGIKLVVK